MSKADRNKQLASMLAEVKFQERQLEKLREKLPALEGRIKQSLKLGDREQAKHYALKFEELKLEIAKGEQKIVLARQQFEGTKGKTREIEEKTKESRTLGKLAESFGKMADSMDVLSRDDDMLRKLEEETAFNEAKLELALDGNPDVDLDPLPPASTAEDILKEFE